MTGTGPSVMFQVRSWIGRALHALGDDVLLVADELLAKAYERTRALAKCG